MKVVIAQPRGFCAGVDRAIQIVDVALERFGAPIYVRKEIVHNQHVVNQFRQKGVIFVEENDEVPDGAVVVFSAHGVAPSVKQDAERRGLRSIDATCPLVSKVHTEVLRYVDKKFALVLIGHQGHDEVVGTLGHAPESITLVTSVADAETVQLPRDVPLMVLTQTTLSMDDTADIMTVLERRYPELSKPKSDDICYATQNRQNAVKAMADRIDLLLVVGSQNSSNAARLVEVGAARGIPGHLIDSADEIDEAWLDGVETIGVTSGASTPDILVQQVMGRLAELGADTVERCDTVIENVVFTLPRELRDDDASEASA